MEDSNSSEFSIRDFSEIKKDKLLKLKEVLKEKESVFSKSSNGKWKFLFQRKKKSVMPSAPYIVCQQLQVILYQSLSFFNQLTKKYDIIKYFMGLINNRYHLTIFQQLPHQTLG
jgi:hypothetical protein